MITYTYFLKIEDNPDKNIINIWISGGMEIIFLDLKNKFKLHLVNGSSVV